MNRIELTETEYNIAQLNMQSNPRQPEMNLCGIRIRLLGLCEERPRPGVIKYYAEFTRLMV